MDDLTRMKILTIKKIHGETSREEDSELLELTKKSPENKQRLEAWLDPATVQRQIHEINKIDTRGLDRRMREKAREWPELSGWSPDTSHRPILRRLAVAASVIALAGGTWWYAHRPATDPVSATQHPPATRSALEQSHLIGQSLTGLFPVPGASPTILATLTWQAKDDHNATNEGSFSILLGELQEGKGYIAGRLQIARMGNQFFLHPLSDTGPEKSIATDYTLAIEGSADIQVFYDSIRIQASPHSLATFTIARSDEQRQLRSMFCSGQFLFDVKANARLPFVVQTPNQQISVLGTCFRIRDFEKEDTSAVFCYNGKVAVNDRNQPSSTFITQSQRITIHRHRQPEISKGDFPEADWTGPELFFDFTGLSLDSIMNQIANWYGYPKVKFRGNPDRTTPGAVYDGQISRYLTLEQLFSILNHTGLHFSIQEDHSLLVER